MARAMKDSGIEWIGEIPEGWEACNIRHEFSFGKGLPITKEDLRDSGEPVISYGQIHSKINTGTTIKPELVRYVEGKYLDTHPGSLAHKGDLIVADTSEDVAGCGNCIYVDTDAPVFAGYHTIILRNKTNHNQRFLSYLFQTDAWRSQIRKQVTGVKLFSISQKILRSTSVIIPQYAEQQRIADFLDTECARIDSVIEQTRASIEEYKKLKQSVITQAVTKGIRPGRKMKDSGVEWIGDIASPFYVFRLKHLLRAPLQYGANESGILYEEGLPRYIRITDISLDGRLKNSGALSLTEEAAKGYILNDNDVLFARSGATVGKAFIYKTEYGRAAFAGYLIRATVNKRIEPEFLFLYTQSSIYEEWKKQIFVQATIQNIGADRYRELPVVIPPIEEQQEIIRYLHGELKEIDSLIERKELLFTELESYKKSLIFEYVTGKKEVGQ